MSKCIFNSLIVCLLILAISPTPAFAYFGPGTGLSAIGALLALLVGVVVAVLGFIWYPVKRLLGRKKSSEPDPIREDPGDA